MLFKKNKENLRNYYFLRFFVFIYHNIVYIFYHCYMDFSFRAFDNAFRLLKAFGSTFFPFWFPRTIENLLSGYLNYCFNNFSQFFSKLFMGAKKDDLSNHLLTLICWSFYYFKCCSFHPINFWIFYISKYFKILSLTSI